MDNNFLPQGDSIRQLLTKTNISETKINQVLRAKGVFLGHAEKNNSIPIFMKTLVSPSDFDELYKIQKVKEKTVKYRTATIKCNSEIDLKETFTEEIDLQRKIEEIHKYKPNFKLIGTPSPYFEENKVIYQYKIEREDLLEDWTENTSVHTGEIIVTKTDKNVELSVVQNSTSKETQIVNKVLINEIRTILETKDLIDKKDDFIRIKFNDFNNVNRIQFLYSFNKKFCIYLDFESITDINLMLDENEESHQDIKVFLDEIDSLKLNGKVLQNHILLKENKYHPKLIFASVSIKYKFNVNGVTGSCILDLSFPEYVYKRELNSEFQIAMKFNIDNEYKKDTTEKDLRKKLLSIIEKQKIDSFLKNKIKSI